MQPSLAASPAEFGVPSVRPSQVAKLGYPSPSPRPLMGVPPPHPPPHFPPKSPFCILQSHTPPFQSCTESVSFLYFKPNFGFFLPLYTPPSGKSFVTPVTPKM